MNFSRKWIYWAVLILCDSLAIYLSFYLAYSIRFNYIPFLEIFPAVKGTPSWNIYHQILKIVIPLWLLVLLGYGKIYQKRFMDAANEFLAILKSASLATALTVSVTFLYRNYEYSRLVILTGSLFVLIFLFLTHEVIKIVVSRIFSRMKLSETSLLIGEGKSVEIAAKLIGRDPHQNLIRVSVQELEKVRGMLSTNHSLNEIFVAGHLLNNDKLQMILDECEDLDIEIKVLPDLLEMRLGEVTVDDSLGVPILHLKPLSLHGFRYFVKRFFDLSVSIAVVSILFIPFLIISFLILIDSAGGIFFTQARIGFKEKQFQCFKFRTMRENAEKLLGELKLESFRGGPAFKMKNDPRITTVGKWIRKFSLDELPQVWNVLKGEMSLIGPRPQVLAEASGNPEWAKKRFRIFPGITGLWQVSGRADLSYEEMMRLDIFYLENWSPGLDLKILLKTLPVILSGKGAY